MVTIDRSSGKNPLWASLAKIGRLKSACTVGHFLFFFQQGAGAGGKPGSRHASRSAHSVNNTTKCSIVSPLTVTADHNKGVWWHQLKLSAVVKKKKEKQTHTSLQQPSSYETIAKPKKAQQIPTARTACTLAKKTRAPPRHRPRDQSGV